MINPSFFGPAGARILLFVLTCAGPAFGFEATQDETNAFLKADQNQDLVLDFDEFVIFVDAMASVGQKTSKTIRFFRAYKRAFKVTDVNRDGVVTPPELRRADDDFQAGKIPVN